MPIPPRRLYFDIEGNGLFPQCDRIHCLGVVDIDTGEEFYFGPAVPGGHPKWDPIVGNPAGSIEDGLRFMSSAALTVGHNAIGYDYPTLEANYPWWTRHPTRAWDSMVAAKLVWPYDALIGPDLKLIRAGRLPQFLMKAHSLKAWGYRLGENKDEYGGDLAILDPERRAAEKWSVWNPYMAAYMMQDCRPGVLLWKRIEARVGWAKDSPAGTHVWPERVFEVEHEVARILFEQEQDGCYFDLDRAEALRADLLNAEADISRRLVETFGSWWEASEEQRPAAERRVAIAGVPDVTIRRFSEKTGKELAPYVGPPKAHYHPDWPYVNIERLTFQPSSRDHLGQRLQAVFGWKPKAYGKNGKPTVDESVLEEIPEAVIPAEVRHLILDYFVVAKTLGMVARGAQSWISICTAKSGRQDHRIHGRIDPAGAVTGRGTHSKPNVSQVPAVRKAKDAVTRAETVLRGLAGRYGWECRELWTADPGWEQTGVDASSLELILLGHYLYTSDEGAFSARVCDPTRDAHQENADTCTEASGFPVTRADAKTTIYLKVYGGSAYKLSLDPAIIVKPEEVPGLLAYRGMPMLLSNLAKRFDDAFVAKLDDMQRARIAKARRIIVALEAGITGLKELTDSVSSAAEQRGWLKGLDGRKVIVRKHHAALNALLQSAGAQAVKLWMVLLHRRLRAMGLARGTDFKQIMWNHDEFQFTHRPGLGPAITKAAQETIKEAGALLGLRGEFRSEGKTGANWAECH